MALDVCQGYSTGHIKNVSWTALPSKLNWALNRVCQLLVKCFWNENKAVGEKAKLTEDVFFFLKKGVRAIIRGRRLFKTLLTERSCHIFFIIFPLNQKKIDIKKTEHGLFSAANLVPWSLFHYQRRLGTERYRRPLLTSSTGDVTSQIAENDWERGWLKVRSVRPERG